MASVAAPITARRSQEKDFHTFGRVFRQCASHAEGLIIGVREHGHQPRSVHETPLHMNMTRQAGRKLKEQWAARCLPRDFGRSYSVKTLSRYRAPPKRLHGIGRFPSVDRNGEGYLRWWQVFRAGVRSHFDRASQCLRRITLTVMPDAIPSATRKVWTGSTTQACFRSWRRSQMA